MDRSSGEGQEQTSSTRADGPLHRALADPEVAQEAAAYGALLPGPREVPAGYADRAEFLTRLAGRHGISDAAAAASLRIAEALRATAAEYPDLTDEEAIDALHLTEATVRRAGVPRPVFRGLGSPDRVVFDDPPAQS